MQPFSLSIRPLADTAVILVHGQQWVTMLHQSPPAPFVQTDGTGGCVPGHLWRLTS